MKVRKIKYKTPKCFGFHSRIVDGVGVKPEDAGGRSVSSKQINPDDYQDGCDLRSRAEKLNSALRNDTE